ncbi:Serine/threonine-protein kinase PknH [Roseimaritima multifibrata]|uniref:Serine/threonine-protein kinase PknH n=2 Tax=Roseimaritima multifibrata TaxID=1930274 RepID=A0A517MEI1_9BACT|nr:Serine/threonine-protein kinase PknH [Roseimaritima multifibrata]
MSASEQTGGGDDFDIHADVNIPAQIGGYRIERLLGEGGMGRVYLAVHGPMERIVALKTLTAARMGSPQAIERFYSEVRAAARLLHPNIVTAFDAGEAEGVHFLAMEYVDGPTLTQMVAERGPLSVPEAVDVLQQTATALHYAHVSSIVHRDIKPSNLMRGPRNVIKLLDLGLATIASDQRAPLESGRVLGTVEYMAPEQLEQANRADARSDIYALGATFFFLLTGRTPYEGDLLAQIQGHRDGAVPDLCTLRHDVDVRLDHVLRRMMAKRPQDRYASLSELLEDLTHWRASATPIFPAPGPAKTWKDRPTVGGDTTSTASTDVVGIDLGMFYGAIARANPKGELESLRAGGHNKPLLRLAIASRGDQLFFGNEALDYRIRRPERVAHCLPLYIGQATVERRVAGECCPPEVLLALVLRQVMSNGWPQKAAPQATAITVPSCYDQLHRRSILQAAQIAGLTSIRLIDRSIAAAQAVLMNDFTHSPLSVLDEPETQLAVAITGNTTEAVLLRRVGGRIQQLATSGAWHSGTLYWQHKLLDIAAQQCMQQYRFDPRESLADATRLQVASEKALRQLLLQPSTSFQFVARNRPLQLTIHRETLFSAVRKWLDRFHTMVEQVANSPLRGTASIQRCITIGSITKTPPIEMILGQILGPNAEFTPLERQDIARGAAVSVAGELPGRDGIPLPPQVCTARSLGVVVHDTTGKRKKVLPIVPQGTALPARTNRRLTPDRNPKSPPTLSIAEASGWEVEGWRSLGRHNLPKQTTNTPAEIGFDVDSNGLLSIRVRNPETGHSEPLPALPVPNLSEEEIQRWQQWVVNLDSKKA